MLACDDCADILASSFTPNQPKDIPLPDNHEGFVQNDKVAIARFDDGRCACRLRQKRPDAPTCTGACACSGACTRSGSDAGPSTHDVNDAVHPVDDHVDAR